MLALALVLHVLFAGACLVRTPAFEGPDESDHAYYAFHLAHTHALPIVWKSMELTGEPAWKNAALGHHPPLYYAILAGLMAVTGNADTTPCWQPASHANSP